MKIVIAEDDLTSRKVLNHFISKLPSYQVVGEAKNGEELISKIITEKPDLAIVDIEMPVLNGMEAIKYCKSLFPELQVIFTTGHDWYAVEAFGISAVDYIIKPIEYDRFVQAIDKVSKVQVGKSEVGVSSKNNEKKLVLQHYSSVTIIPHDEIIFIEKVERKTFIHTRMKVYQNSESLTDLLEKLPYGFVQSHRSYIVNINQLTNIESLGQTYYAYFKDYLEPAKVSKHQIKEIQKMLN